MSAVRPYTRDEIASCIQRRWWVPDPLRILATYTQPANWTTDSTGQPRVWCGPMFAGGDLARLGFAVMRQKANANGAAIAVARYLERALIALGSADDSDLRHHRCHVCGEQTVAPAADTQPPLCTECLISASKSALLRLWATTASKSAALST